MPRFAEPTRWHFGPALRELERWLLPAACLLCDAPVPLRADDELVCEPCRSRWRRVPDPQCPRCGQPTLGDLECRICADWPAGLATARSAVWLAGGAHRAVHLLKYEGWWRLAEPMAEAMRRLEPLTAGVSLIPIPLGARRLRARGYNQSERLAAALGRRVGAPVRPEVLTRGRETTTQTALTPDQRRANVAGAFAARRVRGPVVLVDDVFTTGATLLAAAAALGSAGAERVDAVTFGRAVEPLQS